ncbi:hypothetical protein BV25DRAFT_1766862, partial [Artomyces pyxidatus]
GRPSNEFVDKHFEKVGPQNQSTRRYKVRCKYCPPGSSLIEHRDNRCVTHTSKVQACPNAPKEVRMDALAILARLTGQEVPSSVNEAASGSALEPLTVQDGNPVKKVRLASGAGVAVVKTRSIDGYMDRAMSEAETKMSNVLFLRYLIHTNSAFSSADNPYFRLFTHSLRASYSPAS